MFTDVLAQTKKGEFPPDPALQCYYLCLYGQMKIVSNLSIDKLSINEDGRDYTNELL